MSRRTAVRRVVAVLVAGTTACAPAPDSATEPPTARVDFIARARQDSINRTLPGYIVDSVFPIAEEIRRFRAAVGGPPAIAFEGGVASRDALARAIVEGAVRGDSSALRGLAISPREFADLVYPASPFARPPAQQAPGRVWMTIENPSRTGRTRLLRRLDGLSVSYGGHECDPVPERQGRNRLWTRCTVTLVGSDGSREQHRLFGTIIERDGRFKVVSYTNEF